MDVRWGLRGIAEISFWLLILSKGYFNLLVWVFRYAKAFEIPYVTAQRSEFGIARYERFGV